VKLPWTDVYRRHDMRTLVTSGAGFHRLAPGQAPARVRVEAAAPTSVHAIIKRAYGIPTVALRFSSDFGPGEQALTGE
jgi:hypothetical protein